MYTHAMKAGIIGASGYTGAELLRLLAGHPDIEVAVVTAHSHAGQVVGEHTPSLAAAYPGLVYEAARTRRRASTAWTWSSAPCRTASPRGSCPALRERVGVDRRPGRRLPACRTPRSTRPGTARPTRRPSCWPRPPTGCPSCSGPSWPGPTLIAAAGCYPTAAGLALAPLVRAGLIEPSGIIVDAASGVSGAGRGAKESLHFGTVDEDFTAYGLLTHRHTPEMEQILGAELLFTPHLVPMVRGILATCYARPAAQGPARSRTADVLDALHAAYDDEPFVVVTDAPPSTKATAGSNWPT